MKATAPQTALPSTPASHLRVRDAVNVRIEGLTKYHGAHPALKGLSLEVPAGTFCTLLGPSGCGKTTTLRLLAGLDRPNSGTIWFDDRKVTGDGVWSPPEKRAVGFVFQNYALWPHMTVLEHVLYPLRASRLGREERRQRAVETIERVGLSGRLERYPFQLSGGQQQRVALARALVVRPRLMLLDEPLSNLDVNLREQMRQSLQEMHEAIGATIIYVTHDQEEAIALSDMVALMSDGQIVQLGAPRDLYDGPETAFAAEFIGGSNLLRAHVAGPDGDFVAVRLTDGSVLKGRTTHRFEPGQPALLAIKPEDVVLLDGQSAAAVRNRLDLTVEQTTFVGFEVRLSLTTAAGRLTVRADKSCSVARGEHVAVHLPPDRTTILPD